MRPHHSERRNLGVRKFLKSENQSKLPSSCYSDEAKKIVTKYDNSGIKGVTDRCRSSRIVSAKKKSTNIILLYIFIQFIAASNINIDVTHSAVIKTEINVLIIQNTDLL